MKTILTQLIADDGGQDLIEYALLSGLIGIVGVAAWTNIVASMLSTYRGWDTGVQDLSATMPNPAGGGS